MPHHHHSREELARIEIGHTDIDRGVAVFLTAGFLVLILAVPLCQTLWDAFGARTDGQARRRVPVLELTRLLPQQDERRACVASRHPVEAWRNVFKVNARILRDIGRYEDELKNAGFLTTRVVPWMQVLLTGVLKSGNEDAYCGREGWLFYRRDIDYLTGRGFLEPKVLAARAAQGNEWQAAPQPDPLRAIVDFRDQLASRGIELLVVPMPVKPSLYPEMFSGRFAGDEGVIQNPSYGSFMERLSEAGVMTFDPAALLLGEKRSETGIPLYLKTDTHWTPHGMELVATELAKAARRAADLPAASQPYGVEPQTVTNYGDVAMMLNLPETADIWPAETAVVGRVTDGATRWLPDREAEVLFLGDSFANIFSLAAMGWGEGAGLVEHFSRELGLPVDRITRNDAGSYATREMLSRELRRGSDRLAGKKLVVWEFAARELAWGDWKLLSMVVGEPGDANFDQPPAGWSVTVRGVVRAASVAPRPGSVPYKDHIIMLHLAELGSDDDPEAEGGEAAVFVWSMRDNVQTAVARYRPGDRVVLRLKPWSEVSGKLGAINRSELLDEDLLLAEPCWAELSDGASVLVSGDADVVVDKAPVGPMPVIRVDAADPQMRFRSLCVQRAAGGESMAISGADGWLFLRADFRHLGAGPFWGEAAAAASQASKPEWADPLPVLVDFKRQLERAGVDLLLVPVPPKAVIYPDKAFAGSFEAQGERLDAALQEFYGRLTAEGVEVLDLTDAFLSARRERDERPLYCRTDTHWSVRACELAARAVKEYMDMRGMDALESGGSAFEKEQDEITFVGDLERSLHGEEGMPEKMLARRITAAEGAGTTSEGSPVLLLGDSHTLVFHEGGDMLATGAGLADQLALELGAPVDLLGVRGSAATPARVNLLRRARRDKGYLPGKQVVIYCFAAREFTESQGWRNVPVVKTETKGQ